MSCLYCDPKISSQLNDEINRFGVIEIKDFKLSPFNEKNKKYDEMVQGLWQYLSDQDRYKVIRHYHILGGEPLLQKELDSSINFWRNHPNPCLEFNIVSNLMIPHQKFVEKIQRFQDLVEKNAIYKLGVTASLDCWGVEAEYVRSGLDLDTWTKNFEFLLDKSWIHLAIHSCICSLTIKTLPKLIEKINYWNDIRTPLDPVDYSFDVIIGKVNSTIAMHPKFFDKTMFKQDFEKILALMPTQTNRQKNAKLHMEGLITFIENHPVDYEKISMLKQYLDEIDRRRGTNWHLVFPWLSHDQVEKHI